MICVSIPRAVPDIWSTVHIIVGIFVCLSVRIYGINTVIHCNMNALTRGRCNPVVYEAKRGSWCNL